MGLQNETKQDQSYNIPQIQKLSFFFVSQHYASLIFNEIELIFYCYFRCAWSSTFNTMIKNTDNDNDKTFSKRSK